MRLGKRTAKLVREAAVLGFVEGTHDDLYPTLSNVEAE